VVEDVVLRWTEGGEADVLALQTCADLLGVAPSHLVFQHIDGRPPRVRNQPGGSTWRVSLSHAGGVSVCAAARGRQVGVDVELRAALGDDHESLAAAICTPSELREWLALPAQKRPDRLLELWTAKEATARALCLGHRADLTCLSADAARLALTHTWLTPDHLVAVAVFGEEPCSKLIPAA
jgi:phosphopantetheinyl transferase